MRFFVQSLKSYLRQKVKIIASASISLAIFSIVLYLYSLPLEPIIYASLLVCVFLLSVGIIDFTAFYKRHFTLVKLKNSISISDYMFPSPKGLIESDYQEMVRIIDRERTKIVNEKENTLAEMLDYYTIWAHQIKTPIAAMRLLLQSEQPGASELSEQLFKVEQYVEMVLQYLRIDSMSSDLLLKRYPLDDIVKQSVRKYSKSFIYKKIKLNYGYLNRNVLTDEKWLVFVIEQILSNALKYTNTGEISIYMDNDLPHTLVIEDTGIGIEEEDLPRIFEKGFTGYNGRTDKKSTGIGLYLCKRILTRLSHTISVESTVGRGTKVKIGFDEISILVE